MGHGVSRETIKGQRKNRKQMRGWENVAEKRITGDRDRGYRIDWKPDGKGGEIKAYLVFKSKNSI